MKQDPKLETVIASDVDYAELIAEIYSDGKFVALVSQDDGIKHLKVVFPGCDGNEVAIVRNVGLEWLKQALVQAEIALVDGRR